MLSIQRDRNAWLKTALSEAGKMQKDVAKAWGCDVAVVSRFISTGEPKLTYDRMKALAKLLTMTVQELDTRIMGGTAPLPGMVARQASKAQLDEILRPEERAVVVTPKAETLEGAMQELRKCAAAVQRLLPPGFRITYRIEEGEQS